MNFCTHMTMGSSTHYIVFILARALKVKEFFIDPDGSVRPSPPIIIQGFSYACITYPEELVGLLKEDPDEWPTRFRAHLCKIDGLICSSFDFPASDTGE